MARDTSRTDPTMPDWMASFSMARVSLTSPSPSYSRSSYVAPTMSSRSYEPPYSSTHTNRRHVGSGYQGSRHNTTIALSSPTYSSTPRKHKSIQTRRPLPMGPGPQDAQGHRIGIPNNLSNGTTSTHKTSVYRMRATDARPQPMRADHSTGLNRVSSSHSRNTGSLSSQRTSSVSDLTRNFQNVALHSSGTNSTLSRSRYHGSNSDLSSLRYSTQDKAIKEDIHHLQGVMSPKRTDTSAAVMHGTSRSTKRGMALPDIRNGNSHLSDRASTHSPTPERSGYDDMSARRSTYASSRHSSQSSMTGGHSLVSVSSVIGGHSPVSSVTGRHELVSVRETISL